MVEYNKTQHNKKMDINNFMKSNQNAKHFHSRSKENKLKIVMKEWKKNIPTKRYDRQKMFGMKILFYLCIVLSIEQPETKRNLTVAANIKKKNFCPPTLVQSILFIYVFLLFGENNRMILKGDEPFIGET